MSSAARTAAGDALAVAGIAPERRGRARLERLSDAERSFYRWILRRLSTGRMPRLPALAEEAGRLGLELEGALAQLAREDLVHLEGSEVLVAYPFSGQPTRHRVRFDGREVYAMCAIDALGIAAMLGRSIEVVSSDPLSDEEVRVTVMADGDATWRPGQAVVVTGRACEGVAFRGCCKVLNFFASRSNAERYLRERPEVRGFPISIPEALEAGRLVFAELLEDGDGRAGGPAIEKEVELTPARGIERLREAHEALNAGDADPPAALFTPETAGFPAVLRLGDLPLIATGCPRWAP